MLNTLRFKSSVFFATHTFLDKSLEVTAFLVTFTDPNKQLSNVKSVFKFLNHSFHMSVMDKNIIFFIKRCPLYLVLHDNQQELV